MFKFKPQIWNYGVAIASVIFAAGLMLALNPYIKLTQASFLLFFGAVTVSAWYGGRNPGLLATFLSALCAKYFFLEPFFSLNLTFASGMRMGLFVFQGYLISILVGSLRIAQQQSRRSLQQLQESQARFRRLVDSNIIGVVSGDIYVLAPKNDRLLGDLLPFLCMSDRFFNHAVVARTVGTAWLAVDPAAEEAARTLGADRWAAFRTVTLPQLRPAIAGAAAIVFQRRVGTATRR